MIFLGKHHAKNSSRSSPHKLSSKAHKFAKDASNSIYESALQETTKDLGEAIDSAVEAYTEETLGLGKERFSLLINVL